MSVQTQIDRLNTIKERIRTNLVAQGITVPADSMLEEMATMILSVAGEDGYTPQKGVDYWTEADKEAIVQDVIAALGTPVFGTVDADNNIILTGVLADGTYTFKYEDAEGNVTTIGTLTAAGAPTYTNVLPLAIDSDGTLYNGGQGWKTDTRLGSSGAESTSNAAGMEVTGFIPVAFGDTLYFKNVEWIHNGTTADRCYFHAYNSSFTTIANTRADNNDTAMNSGAAFTFDANNNLKTLKLVNNGGFSSVIDNVAYIRFSASGIDDSSVITKNEPIE